MSSTAAFPVTPNIVKETSNGYFLYSIPDEMLLHREIECLGEISPESVNSMILQVRYLARQEPGSPIRCPAVSPCMTCCGRCTAPSARSA